MLKRILWNNKNEPVMTSIDAIMDGVRDDDIQDGLLYDAPTMSDILSGADMDFLDGIVVNFVKLRAKMLAMKRIMNTQANDEQQVVGDPIISDPFMRLGTAQVAVLFQLKDGQAITIYFHNPDSDPKKIKPNDPLVSFKFLLNKKDVTIVVAAEKGREINVREVAMRVMKLANKNSAAFLRQNKKAAERKAMIEELTKTVETKKGILVKKLKEIEVLEAVQEQAKIDSELKAKEQVKANEEFDKQAVKIIKEVKEYAESQGYFINQEAFKNNQLYVYDNKENKGSFLNVVVFDMGEEKGSKHYYEIQEYINFALKGHDINSHAEAKELALDIINRKKEFDKTKVEQEKINQFARQFQPEVKAELQTQKENGEEQNLKKAVETVKRKQLELEELRKQRTPEEMERFEGYKAQAQTLKNQLSILFKNSLNKVNVSLENDTTDGNYIVYATGESKEGTFNIKINTGESTTGGFVATLFSTEQVDYERTPVYNDWKDLFNQDIIPFIDKYVPKNENGQFDVQARKVLKEIKDFAIDNGYLASNDNKRINSLLVKTPTSNVNFLSVFVPDMDAEFSNIYPRTYEIYGNVTENTKYHKTKNHEEAKRLALAIIKEQMDIDLVAKEQEEQPDQMTNKTEGKSKAEIFDIASQEVFKEVKSFAISKGFEVEEIENRYFNPMMNNTIIVKLNTPVIQKTILSINVDNQGQSDSDKRGYIVWDEMDGREDTKTVSHKRAKELAIDLMLQGLKLQKKKEKEKLIEENLISSKGYTKEQLNTPYMTNIELEELYELMKKGLNWDELISRIKPIVQQANLQLSEYESKGTKKLAILPLDSSDNSKAKFEIRNNADRDDFTWRDLPSFIINAQPVDNEKRLMYIAQTVDDAVNKVKEIIEIAKNEGVNSMRNNSLNKILNNISFENLYKGTFNLYPVDDTDELLEIGKYKNVTSYNQRKLLNELKQKYVEEQTDQMTNKALDTDQSETENKHKESLQFLNDVISNNVDVTQDETLERLEKSVSELMEDPNYETEYKALVDEAVEAYAKLTDEYTQETDNA